MPKNDDDKFEFIPVDEDIAEWRKDPEYMKAYESLKPKYDKLRRQIKAKDARIARRKAMVARVRGVWAYLTRGVGGEVL
ncbi:MAG: hypothetical protein MJE68_09730, partial [Proteobacteria bacterium]|nr:hypothetical protein [Pseudomonadota bacterium]